MILSHTNWLTEIAAFAQLNVPVMSFRLVDLAHQLRHEAGSYTIDAADKPLVYCRGERIGNMAPGWLSLGDGISLNMRWVKVGFGDRAVWVCPRCGQGCTKMYLLGEQHNVMGCTRCMRDRVRRLFRRQAKALRLEDRIRHGRPRYMHHKTLAALKTKIGSLRKMDYLL